MNLVLISLLSLLLLFFIISLNTNKLNFFMLFFLLIAFLRLSSTINISWTYFELNNLNFYSILFILFFSLIVYKNIYSKIYGIFISILAILSLNNNLVFFLIFEIFYFTSFILDKNTNLNNKFLRVNYLISTIIGISIYTSSLYNLNFYISIVCVLYIIRYFIISKFLFYQTIPNYFLYYLIIYQIILSNYLFKNSTLILFSKVFILFLIALFILYNSIIYIKKTYFDNTIVLSNYCLLLIPLSLFASSNNMILLSYSIPFLLFFMLVNKVYLSFFNFILLPIPISPLFYFEIHLIGHLSSYIYTPLLAVLFIFFMFYKIKNIDFFASKLKQIFIRV